MLHGLVDSTKSSVASYSSATKWFNNGTEGRIGPASLPVSSNHPSDVSLTVNQLKSLSSTGQKPAGDIWSMCGLWCSRPEAGPSNWDSRSGEFLLKDAITWQLFLRALSYSANKLVATSQRLDCALWIGWLPLTSYWSDPGAIWTESLSHWLILKWSFWGCCSEPHQTSGWQISASAFFFLMFFIPSLMIPWPNKKKWSCMPIILI